MIKINLDAKIAAQSVLEVSFLKTSDYPPAVMKDLSVSVEEAGCEGDTVS